MNDPRRPNQDQQHRPCFHTAQHLQLYNSHHDDAGAPRTLLPLRENCLLPSSRYYRPNAAGNVPNGVAAGVGDHLRYPNAGAMSAAQVVQNINHAVTQSQRLEALRLATRCFRHRQEDMHDFEILELGAAHALCLKLGYALLQSRSVSPAHSTTTTITANHDADKYQEQQRFDIWLELGLICSALNMIYGGCSLEVRQRSFEEVGRTELMSLLMRSIDLCLLSAFSGGSKQMARRVSSSAVKEDLTSANTSTTSDEFKPQRANVIIQSLLVVRSFAKLDAAKETLVKMEGGKLLTILTAIIIISPAECSERYQVDDPPPQSTPTLSSTSWNNAVLCDQARARMEALALVKDLTFRASNVVRSLVCRHPGLIDAMMVLVAASFHNNDKTLAHRHLDELTECEAIMAKLSEHATAALWNMAMTENLRIELANRDDVLNALLRFLTSEDDNAKTRKNAASALGNLATAEENRVRLARYDGGVILTALLKIAKDDVDSSARRRAMRTLRCLASDGDTSYMTRNYSFMIALKDIIVRDPDNDTRAQTAETLVLIASSERMDDDLSVLQQHRSTMLQVLLEAMTDSNDGRCIEILFRSVAHHVTLASKANLFRVMDHPDLFEALGKVVALVFGDEEERYDAADDAVFVSRLYHRLSRDDANKAAMSTTLVLDALSRLLSLSSSSYGGNLAHERRISIHAVGAIAQLATLETNRMAMASHSSLLIHLVNYALVAPDGSSTKDEAKDAIVKLVQVL